MPIAEVRKQRTTPGTGSTHTASLSVAPANGNLLVAVVGMGLNGNNPGTITAPAGWSLAVHIQQGTVQTVGIYYKVAASEGTSWQWASANSTQASIEIFEVSGLDATQTNVLDKTASNNPGAGTATTGSTGTTPTTTVADEWCVGGVAIGGTSGGSGATWTNSFVNDGEGASRLMSSSRTVSATGAYETTATWTNVRTRVGAIATFKAPSAAPQTVNLTAPTRTWQAQALEPSVAAPPGGITQVQKNSGQDGSTTLTHPVSLAAAPAAGNLVIAVIGWSLTGADPGTITPPAGWSVAVERQRSALNKEGIYYKVAGASEPSSWNFTTGNTVVAGWWAYEYDGLDSVQATVLDQTASADSATTSVSSLNVGTTPTTTKADELWVAGAVCNTTQTSPHTWTNSFTGETITSRLSAAVRIVAATAAATTTAGFSASGVALGVLATFEGSAAAAPQTVNLVAPTRTWQARPLVPSTAARTVNLVAPTRTWSAQPLSSSTAARTVNLTAPTRTWQARALTAATAARTVSITAPSRTWQARALTASTAARTANLTAPTRTWQARALTASTGARTVSLTAPSRTWQARPLVVTGQARSVSITAASRTWQARALLTSAGVPAQTVSIGSASRTWQARPLTVTGQARVASVSAATRTWTARPFVVGTGARTVTITAAARTWQARPLLPFLPAPPTAGWVNVWTGTAWKLSPVKVWSGTAWVLKPVKVWTGTAWQVA